MRLTRRSFFAAAAAAPFLGAVPAPAQPAPTAAGRFRIALNTGTLRGYKLPLAEQIELAIAAGFEGVEPWIADMAEAAKTPGLLARLAARCKEAKLAVIDAIGFAQWAVEDEAARRKGLDDMARDMELVAGLGGTRIAAPPAGVYGPETNLDLDRAAERYRAVLELGDKTGITPQLEFWGRSHNLNRISQCLYVASAAAHPRACILADVFHMYTGGSKPSDIRFLSPATSQVFHLNDYPATPDRATATDKDRVWPGDGIAPIKEMLGLFRANGTFPWLSVELFHEAYWKAPAASCARTAFEKASALLK